MPKRASRLPDDLVPHPRYGVRIARSGYKSPRDDILVSYWDDRQPGVTIFPESSAHGALEVSRVRARAETRVLKTREKGLRREDAVSCRIENRIDHMALQTSSREVSIMEGPYLSYRDPEHLELLLAELRAAGVRVLLEDRGLGFRRGWGRIHGWLWHPSSSPRPVVYLGFGHPFNPLLWPADARLVREIQRVFLANGSHRIDPISIHEADGD